MSFNFKELAISVLGGELGKENLAIAACTADSRVHAEPANKIGEDVQYSCNLSILRQQLQQFLE